MKKIVILSIFVMGGFLSPGHSAWAGVNLDCFPPKSPNGYLGQPAQGLALQPTPNYKPAEVNTSLPGQPGYPPSIEPPAEPNATTVSIDRSMCPYP